MSEPSPERSGIFVPLSPGALGALGNLALAKGMTPEGVMVEFFENGVAEFTGNLLEELARDKEIKDALKNNDQQTIDKYFSQTIADLDQPEN
jgi:hypothetical protein